jgi:hypothetical protein
MLSGLVGKSSFFEKLCLFRSLALGGIFQEDGRMAWREGKFDGRERTWIERLGGLASPAFAILHGE